MGSCVHWGRSRSEVIARAQVVLSNAFTPWSDISDHPSYEILSLPNVECQAFTPNWALSWHRINNWRAKQDARFTAQCWFNAGTLNQLSQNLQILKYSTQSEIEVLSNVICIHQIIFFFFNTAIISTAIILEQYENANNVWNKMWTLSKCK